jgi:hypothetical protein
MKRIPLAFGAMFLLMVASGAGGTILSFDLDTEISGATPPAGATPWLSATFDDSGTPGSVELTLTAVNLTGTEFVSVWLFNLDPSLNPALLTFSAPLKTGTFTTPVISKSVDGFKADGDGFFDIKIAFDKSGARPTSLASARQPSTASSGFRRWLPDRSTSRALPAAARESTRRPPTCRASARRATTAAGSRPSRPRWGSCCWGALCC